MLDQDMIMVFCKALIMLRAKGLVAPTTLLELFFGLFRCPNKLLRKTLFNYIIQDIKNLNIKHKNVKVNTVSASYGSQVMSVYANIGT